jgi:hypothetical protein
MKNLGVAVFLVAIVGWLTGMFFAFMVDPVMGMDVFMLAAIVIAAYFLCVGISTDVQPPAVIVEPPPKPVEPTLTFMEKVNLAAEGLKNSRDKEVREAMAERDRILNEAVDFIRNYSWDE